MATTNFDSAMSIEVSANASIRVATGLTEVDPDDGEHVVPGELRRVLADLRLLRSIPFAYLVPDAALLPQESIRFFYVDRDWTDAIVQGALSVGTITTSDRAQLETVYPHLRTELDRTERARRRPRNEERLEGPAGTVTGFLLRSRVVSGWPGLHVRAYLRDELADDALTDEAESSPDRLKLLRVERLAPAVLLVLIDGVPEVVHIEEPRQGIQFGARSDPDEAPDRRRIRMRDLDTGDLFEPVDDFTDTNSIPVPFRANAPGVIDLAEVRRRMAPHLDRDPEPDDPLPLQPHEFALQMLRFPYRQVFGDPDDADALKFYDLDQFRVTTGFSAWNDELRSHLQTVTPDTDGEAPR